MLTLEAVREARGRVMEVARHTPLEYSHSFSEMTGADVHLKLETFQRTGSFKIRGATNRIATLSPAEREAGVVTASAGNHAQGVALAATRAGVDATIVMPEYAPISKVDATRRYGGRVILHGRDYDEAEERAHEIAEAEDRTYVHAFDDELVMAGQGTIGLEILEDCPDVDTVAVPIGGGGLVAGVATAVTELAPDVRVVGVQAAGAAATVESLRAGHVVELDAVDTIADGIATRRPGDRTYPVIRDRVDEVVTVSEEAIAVALTQLLERAKTLVEGAGAVPLAALLEGAFDYTEGETVVPALCGGNIDMNTLTTVVMRGLVQTGRYLKLRTVLKDRPGSLEDLIATLAAEDVNIYAIRHDRTSRDVALNAAEVELDLETRGHDHCDRVVDRLRTRGYDVTVLN